MRSDLNVTIDIHEYTHILLHYEEELRALLDATFVGCPATPETEEKIRVFVSNYLEDKLQKHGYYD